MLKKKIKKIRNQKKNKIFSLYKANILSSSKKNEFLQNYKLSTNGHSLFFRKGLLFNDAEFLKRGDKYLLNLETFYRTKTLINFRNKLKQKRTKIINLKKSSLTKPKPFLNSNNFFINIVCLNRLINKSSLSLDYAFYKKYKQVLFGRNYNLWLDFIKCTDLVVRKLLDVKVFLSLIGLLFKYLNKKKHKRFLQFISNLFDHLIKTNPNQIKGLKLIISGRLLAKARSSVAKIERGTVNITCMDADLISSQMHVYTLYGAFGLKLYLNYKK